MQINLKRLEPIINKIKPYITRATDAYQKLSAREQKLLWGGIAVALVISTLIVTRPISSLFDEQTLEMTKAVQEARTLAGELNRYQRLIQRRAEIERDFKSVEIKEGALSQLEGLIRNKAGIDQGNFTIKDQPPKPFGKEYQQTLFNVNFTTTDYPRLMDFLQEVAEGQRPLLLKRIDLKRSRSGDKLEVELEISSITKERA